MSASSARLENIWLASSVVDAEPREALQERLRLGLELEDLDYEALDAERSVVRVGFVLGLLRSSDREPVVEVAGTYRLRYRMAPLREEGEQRAFATHQGLVDAWPVWRTWAISTLALMGYSPPPLSPVLPDTLLRAGPEEFDLTRTLARTDPAPG